MSWLATYAWNCRNTKYPAKKKHGKIYNTPKITRRTNDALHSILPSKPIECLTIFTKMLNSSVFPFHFHLHQPFVFRYEYLMLIERCNFDQCSRFNWSICIAFYNNMQTDTEKNTNKILCFSISIAEFIWSRIYKNKARLTKCLWPLI